MTTKERRAFLQDAKELWGPLDNRIDQQTLELWRKAQGETECSSVTPGISRKGHPSSRKDADDQETQR